MKDGVCEVALKADVLLDDVAGVFDRRAVNGSEPARGQADPVGGIRAQQEEPWTEEAELGRSSVSSLRLPKFEY